MYKTSQKGIGFACAQQLLELGASVVICSRTEQSVNDAVNQLKVHCNNGMENQNVYGCVCDISTSEGRLILKNYVEKELDGQLDCLINNVGTNKRAPIEESTEEEYEIMIKTNLDSCFFLCKIFSSHLLKTNGCIVNVASVAGIASSGTGSIYAATKGAMIQLTRALACEWGARNVRVNCVAPWMTYTPLLKEATKDDPSSLEKAMKWTPMQRLAEPEESASAVAFLCLTFLFDFQLENIFFKQHLFLSA